MADRPLVWLGTSLLDVRDFPSEARRSTGYQLRRVQRGLMPTDWKPMTTVGAGVAEIRIHTQLEHRVLFVARFEEAIYVLHAFEKKSQRAPVADLALARVRLKEIEAARRTRKEK